MCQETELQSVARMGCETLPTKKHGHEMGVRLNIQFKHNRRDTPPAGCASHLKFFLVHVDFANPFFLLHSPRETADANRSLV